MKKPLAAALGLAFVVTFYPAVAPAAATCADVEAAKSLLKKQTVAMKSTQTPRSLAGARSQDVQAPRSQDIQAPRSQDIQAPRSQDIQAPRSQDIQAPRSQDIQAPRSQDIQAPRSQDIQAPRSQDIQAPRSQDTQAPRSGELKQAATLVKEADAACKAGNSSLATVKANAAMELLNK
jgi:hypothetical protein